MHFKTGYFLLTALLFVYLPFSAQNQLEELSADSLLKLSQKQIYKNPDLASDYAKLAVEKARKDNLKSAEALGLIYLGVIGEIQAEYEKGFDYLNQAQQVARENNLPDKEGLALMNIGNLHFRLENFDFAIRYFMDANRLFQTNDNHKFTAAVLNNLAIIYEEYEDYDNALKYLDSSESMYSKFNIQQNLNRNMESRARVYTLMGKPEKSLPLLDSISAFNERDSISYDLSLNYFNYGETYLSLGDTMKAMKNYKMALNLFDDLGMHRESGEANREIAKLLSEIGKNSEALEFMQQAIANFEEANDTKRLQDAYNLLGDIQVKLGRDDEALINYVLANRWDDTLAVRNIAQMKDRLQVSRNSQKQRDELIETRIENRVLEEKAESRTMWLTIISVLLGVSIILAIWLYFSRQQKQRFLQTLKTLNEKIANQNKELEELNIVKTRMFSIIGHDLRSPLAALHGSLELINSGRMTEEEKSQMLISLSEAVTHTRVTLDNLFHWAKDQMDGSQANRKLFDFSDILDDTLPLYNWMMKQKGISFKNDCDDSLPVFADRDQMRFVLRNLLHNAFKFTHEGGEVVVSCKKEKGSRTEILIKDTGVGISEENVDLLKTGADLDSSRGTHKEVGSGLGLKMCFQFLFQNDGDLQVKSTSDEGTEFRIVLPAREM